MYLDLSAPSRSSVSLMFSLFSFTCLAACICPRCSLSLSIPGGVDHGSGDFAHVFVLSSGIS